jgi:flagellar hook assembly protein FlgD
VDEMVYPNPFQHYTRIDMNFKSTQTISLKIYDTQGKLVRTLINGNRIPQGNFTVLWDGNDESGRRLAAGIYHYSIQNEQGIRRPGKIVLMQ